MIDISKFSGELSNIFKGFDGNYSGKRVLGTISLLLAFIFTGIAAIYNLHHTVPNIADETLLIAPLYATGLTLWGITAYYTQKQIEALSTTAITTAVDDVAK